MRQIAFLLLASTVGAWAAPIDSALSTSQGVNSQRRISAYGQAQATESEAVPELYPGENEDVGPQMIVLSKFRKTFFEAGADVQYYYTSNVFLSEQGNVDTGLLVSTAYVGLAPTPIDMWGGKVAFRAGYLEQVYNYGLDSTANQLNNLDFAVGTAYLAGRYTFGSNLTLSAGVNYNRYLSLEDDLNEFYTEALPNWGFEKIFEINDRNSFTLGYFGAYHLTYTDPLPSSDINDRLDSIFLATFVSQITDKIVLQPYYRFQQSHYTVDGNRDDCINTFGVAVSYLINDWSSVRAFTSYEMRESTDRTIPDYHKLDTGVGVSVSIKF